MKYARTVRRIALLLTLGFTACSHDASAPSVPAVAVALPSAPFIVSNPVLSTAGKVAYVSLAPAAIPGGVSARFRVLRTGAVVAPALTNGGLDPTPITALAGDTISVMVQGTDAQSSLSMLFTVPAMSPPVIVRTSPAQSQQSVPLAGNVEVVFSKPIDPATLTSAAVHLTAQGSVVAGDLSFEDNAHTSVQFKAAAPFAGSVNYQLNVTSAVKDVDGVALAAPALFTFSTVYVPTLSVASVWPSSQQTEVHVYDPDIQVIFSEPIGGGLFDAEGNYRLQLRLDGVPIDGRLWLLSSQPASGWSRLDFAPLAPLAKGTTYEVQVSSGFIGVDGAVLTTPVSTFFTTENPPPGPSAAVLSVSSFTMVEFKYSESDPHWYYAPLLRLTETGGTSGATFVKLSFTIPGFGGPSPAACSTGTPVAAGQSVDLFHEVYGDYEYEMDKPGPDGRATGAEATGVVVFRDDAGRTDSILVHGPIVPGALPTTYTGGGGHYFAPYPSCQHQGPVTLRGLRVSQK